MRDTFLDIIRCPLCKESSFRLEVATQDKIEIREGRVFCQGCGSSYGVSEGILNFLNAPKGYIKSEQDAVAREGYFQDAEGIRYRVDKDSIQKFREQLLMLPEGDGSCFFRRGGCFQPIAEGAHRFYGTLKQMGLRGDECILSIGDGFGYASYKFATHGCKAVSVDIAKYLLASELYARKAYFERAFSDMHDMPFKDGIFDIVFCSAVLHHSKDLERVFSEISRLLRQGGRAFVINESSRGIIERKSRAFDELETRGYGDTCYTLSEWRRAAEFAGFGNVRIDFFSIAADYIIRQRNKGRERGIGLDIACFLKRHPKAEGIEEALMKYPRIFFRPRSWRMICSK